MLLAVKLILLFLTAQPNPGIFADTSVERIVSTDGIECIIIKIGGTSKVTYKCRDMLKRRPTLPGVVPQYNYNKKPLIKAYGFTEIDLTDSIKF